MGRSFIQFRMVLGTGIQLLFLVVALHTVDANAADPWESANRKVFGFNEQLDKLVLRPAAQFYIDSIPRPIRHGVGNFFNNINDVNVLFNDVLQLKFDRALEDSARLAINTTVGVGGLIDVAASIGLTKNAEDFGQTLASWQIESGPYVVLPLFGPSTVTDAFGRVVDLAFNPLQLLSHEPTQMLLFVTNEVDYRASILSLDELIIGDRYLFLREAYLQRREFLVMDGQLIDEFVTDFNSVDENSASALSFE